MDKFLKGLGFDKKNPPNAAVQLISAAAGEDTIVVELLNPKYDAAKKTLQYEVKILTEGKKGLAIFNESKDKVLPAKFGPTSLFIDDCNDADLQCCSKNNVDPVGSVSGIPMCWNLSDFACEPCRVDAVVSQCNSTYPQCGGACVVSGDPFCP